MTTRPLAAIVALIFAHGLAAGCSGASSAPTAPTEMTTSAASLPAPSISGLSPSMGVVAGGTQVEITGTGLGSRTVVTFDGLVAPVRGWGPAGTALSVITPAHGPGPVDVAVTNPGGQSSRLSGGFIYGAAARLNIAALSTPAGLTAGGTYLSIGGTGLQPGLKVTFDNRDARVIYSTPTRVWLATPPHAAGAVDVVVTTADGQVARLERGYTYLPPQSADFNGVWEGRVGDEDELAFTFTVENDTLMSVSCGGRAVVLSSQPSTRGGEFSVSGNRGATMTGALLGADSAEGTIDMTGCTYDTAWNAKKR